MSTEARGWIKIWRRAKGHWLWTAKPYDQWHAFEYLLVWAADRPEERTFQGQVFVLKRGQHVTTGRQLVRDWKWGWPRVRRFLKTLEKTHTVVAQTERGCIVVTICNFDRWQGSGSGASRPRSGNVSTGVAPASHEERREEEEKKRSQNLGEATANAFDGGKEPTEVDYDRIDLLLQAVPPSVRTAVLEFVGFAANGHATQPGVEDMTRRLMNLYESRKTEPGPHESDFCRAVSLSIRYKAKSVEYVGTVLRDLAGKGKEAANAR